ncbi:MAG: DUF2069 domain-containing protein [Pseudomonadales bacterium]|jgi:uncharacterized membrane protein|nr:DUF2069 domain-containing protein [Pseudomonadales bacterium]
MSSRRAPGTVRSDRPSPAERLWHFLMLISIGSLFAVFGLVRLFGSADAGSPASFALLAAQTLPLLLFVPALLRGSARAAAGVSFVSLLYFAYGVMAVLDPAARLSGGAALFFAISLFISSTFFARQRGLRDQALAGPASGEGES